MIVREEERGRMEEGGVRYIHIYIYKVIGFYKRKKRKRVCV